MTTAYRRLLAERERDWHRLAELLHRVRKGGLRTLDGAELSEFVGLYRRAASDLSLIRSRGFDSALEDYLNLLVSGAHNQVYRTRNLTAGDIGGFFTREFPRAVRRHIRAVLLAAGLFLSTALLGCFLQVHDPAFHHAVVPSNVEESLASSEGEPWFHEISVFGIQPQASSFIMANNITVTFSAFALGVAGGLGTAYILLLNGLLLGTVFAMTLQYAVAGPFAAFLAPHGALELPAIFIAGGAGLVLGSAIMTAGRYRRRDELRIRGLDAVKMAVGCVPLLVVAGLVEGFISPIPDLPVVKPAIGALLFALLVLYLSMGGRGAPGGLPRDAGPIPGHPGKR